MGKIISGRAHLQGEVCPNEKGLTVHKTVKPGFFTTRAASISVFANVYFWVDVAALVALMRWLS